MSGTHHRIQPALSQRMTPQQPPTRHHSAAHRAMPLDRFHRVFRTSRHVAARRRKRWRNPPFVKPQQPQQGRLHFSTSFFAIASSARPTSSSTTANSSFSTDFFGLITTSTPTTSTAPASASSNEDRRSRTASLSRRFIRFRSTAPPHSPHPPLHPVPPPPAPQHAPYRNPNA